ncbi:MAG: DinB family protein [Thermomicrobiales bacterium]|nr:DinB family protein [Thermomicrobiales bacterium]
MSRASLSTGDVLTLLEETPARIAARTSDLSPEQLRTAPAPGEWSVNDVIAHLRSCADVWGGCIATILAEETPTIRAMDPRTWTTRTDYPALTFKTSFDAFAGQRAALLATLHGLPPEGWARSAVVTGAGKQLVRTVHFYAAWLARHEQPHLKQIERIARGFLG